MPTSITTHTETYSSKHSLCNLCSAEKDISYPDQGQPKRHSEALSQNKIKTTTNSPHTQLTKVQVKTQKE